GYDRMRSNSESFSSMTRPLRLRTSHRFSRSRLVTWRTSNPRSTSNSCQSCLGALLGIGRLQPSDQLSLHSGARQLTPLKLTGELTHRPRGVVHLGHCL